MAKYRTAQGRTIDMTELLAKNERTRAVGNMKVNARGDTIDAYGKIIEPVTNKVTNQYSKTVGNRSAQPVRNSVRQVNKPRKGNDPIPKVESKLQTPVAAQPQKVLPELTEQERMLEAELEDDIEVENIKARETKNGN
jgi:hypothetical protein